MKRRVGMNLSLKRFPYRAPRLLGLLFTAFTALCALDVCGMGPSPAQTLLALLIQRSTVTSCQFPVNAV